ncbi:MAG TPA: PIG-L deacetylase family protein [Cyclobacteriaceae bacterium]
MIRFFYLTLLLSPFAVLCQPDQPIEEWTDKTVLLIGAHPDDDHMSHGTLAMLDDHGNDVYILILTTGNVGTRDPKLSRNDLSRIRRQEQLSAMKALGISEENYINLGYDDGRVEFADREELVGKLVYWIRKLKPDVLMAFDPGFGYPVWHKADHRAAAYRAADASRAAEWRLLYEGQIIHEGLEAHLISEYLFFDGNEGDQNVKVDITDYVDKRIEAGMKYICQFSSGWENYRGPNLEEYPEKDQKEFYNRIKNRITYKNGKAYESFRYYKGIPDGIGRKNRY